MVIARTATLRERIVRCADHGPLSGRLDPEGEKTMPNAVLAMAGIGDTLAMFRMAGTRLPVNEWDSSGDPACDRRNTLIRSRLSHDLYADRHFVYGHQRHRDDRRAQQ